MAHDRLTEWAGLTYGSPPPNLLRALLRAGYRHQLGGRSTFPAEMPHPERKMHIELVDAAVFTHGFRQLRPELKIAFAMFEDQDYDFVLRFGSADDPIIQYNPFQLKVFVSADVDLALTMERLLDKLPKKYSDALDLSVAVKVDRPGVDLRGLEIPPLRIGALWFFGPLSKTGNRWFLYGDCLDATPPIYFEFDL
jgi:hypothetical protein